MSGNWVYTVDEVAARLKVSAKTVYTLIHEQQLQYIRVRGRIRIPAKALEDYIEGGITGGKETESYTLQEEQLLLR